MSEKIFESISPVKEKCSLCNKVIYEGVEHFVKADKLDKIQKVKIVCLNCAINHPDTSCTNQLIFGVLNKEPRIFTRIIFDCDLIAAFNLIKK